ncbi:DNA repair protein RadA, partial [Patescibacteria group bacterium]|nr:DNA repair protein RadA [Patescibacteria group bacterium]
SDGAGIPGSVLVATLEGSRSFLVELQGLVVRSGLPMPRRVVSGCDPRRVELLLAVLQKHCRIPLETMDVFVNVAGGLKLSDPGTDLGVCLAVFSSFANISLSGVVGIAEVGLLGELRLISGLDKRVREAKRLGFKRIITAKTHKTLKDVITSLSEVKSQKSNVKS